MHLLQTSRFLRNLRWPLCTALALACEIRVEHTPASDTDGDRIYDPSAPLEPHDPLPAHEPGVPPDPSDEPYPPETPELPSDLYSALLALDPALVGGPLASSANADAPFSFRAQMEWLAGDRDALDFTRAWLLEWETVTAVGPAQAPVTPRPGARELLLDRWLSASGNAAAQSAGYDAGAGELDWGHAPFQLIAIVNRIDLATGPCDGAGGELRLIYTAVDPITSEVSNMTLSIEIPYPTTRTSAEWARAWQELGRTPSGYGYATALERLVREVQAEADPLRVRVLSSEVAFANPYAPSWEMREFHVQVSAGALALEQAPLEHTPRADVDPAQLAEYVLAHADALRSGGSVALPEELRAGAAEIASPDFTWRVLGVSETLRHAFSVQTCNGCHGGDVPTLPFRHIVPATTPARPARVSPFLYDPDAPSDELRRRSLALDELAASVCEPSDGAGYPPRL
jgi:hypothetical protein